MGFAQVRLTLDNAAHTLDVDADEVTIGRKYYRSGDSEYTINGQVCRLRDVYELLLDTGIGTGRLFGHRAGTHCGDRGGKKQRAPRDL